MVKRTDEFAKELYDWWLKQAALEAEATITKAIEYSSTDLSDIGDALAEVAGWETSDRAILTELGIAFYALGKISRILGAIKDHRLPNSDNWLDLGVYARMAQRNREVGSWPGAPE